MRLWVREVRGFGDLRRRGGVELGFRFMELGRGYKSEILGFVSFKSYCCWGIRYIFLRFF